MATMSDETAIEWSDKFSIGVEMVDEQHKVLVHILNRLNVAVSRNEGEKVIRGIIDSLIEYTKAHFALEEKLMAAAHYSGLEAHVIEHRQFTEKVYELAEQYWLENKPIDHEVVDFLREWLTDHVLETDTKLGKALRESNFPTAEWEAQARREFPPQPAKTKSK